METTEEATRQLQMQSHIDNIQEAIDVIISMVPPEESEKDSRILRAIHGLYTTQSYLKSEL